MRKRYALLGATVTLALALAVPALGGPSNPIARSALSLSKVNKTAKAAKTDAATAQAAAAAAQAAASAAQATANGKQDRIRWAIVNETGVITDQSGGIVMQSSGAGQHYLNFGSSQLDRAILVTPNFTTVNGDSQAWAYLCGGTGNPGGNICAPGGTNNTNHVFVGTQSSTGANVARPFYIATIP
jgi:hypothetical protein